MRAATPVQTTLAIIGICFGMLSLSVFGTADGAWASTGPAMSAGPTPSPYPDPNRRPPGTKPDRPAVPAPLPPLPPPPGDSATDDIAFPHAALMPAPAWMDVPAISQVADVPVATPPPDPALAAAPAAMPTKPAPDLAQSLVYSGALALFIAGSGLIMLGSRRRLW